VARRPGRDAALTSRGFEHVRELPEVALDFEKAGESIHVLLVEVGSSGALVCRGFESWPFPDGSLDGPLCRIGDAACRTLEPHALL
jgi:hypothetical protein